MVTFEDFKIPISCAEVWNLRLLAIHYDYNQSKRLIHYYE